MNDRDPHQVRAPVRIDLAGGWTDVPDFAAREGGAVLNAAIEPFASGRVAWNDEGLRLDYRLELPADSHLGTSATANVVWLKLIFALTGKERSPREIAEAAFALDGVLGEKGGKQDQYAAALGGVNLLRFGAAEDRVTVEPVELDEERRRDLEAHLLLCWTGASEESGDLHKEVWRRYGEGDAAIARALRALRDTVEPARAALVGGDYAELGALLTANREAARRLGGGAVTPRMDRLFSAAEAAGALGGKPCGAGGGGYILLAVEPARRGAVADALEALGADLRDVRLAAGV